MTINKILERLNSITIEELERIKIRSDLSNIVLYLDDCKIILDTYVGTIFLAEKNEDTAKFSIRDIPTIHMFAEILKKAIVNDKVDEDILKEYTYKIVFNINLDTIKDFTTENDVYGNFIIRISDNVSIRTKNKVVVLKINNNRYSFIDEVISMKIMMIVLRCSFKSKTDIFLEDIKEFKFSIDKQ